MAQTSSNESEPSFDNHMARIERLKSKMEDLRATRKHYQADFAIWDRMVYLPDGFRETIKGIIRKNIILDRGEWERCLHKKAGFAEKIKQIDEKLVLLQEKMDPLLLGLIGKKPAAI